MRRAAGFAVFGATLLALGRVDSAVARGGGFSRGGPAARGSFGQNRAAGGLDRGAYNVRGPAVVGSLGTQSPRGEWEGDRQERLEARQERRDDRQEDRTEGRDNWQDYAEDHDDDYYYYDDGDYYGAAAAGLDEPYYWTLPCKPLVMAMGGTTYYVCDSVWYTRAYVDGDVAYTIVPNPNLKQTDEPSAPGP